MGLRFLLFFLSTLLFCSPAFAKKTKKHKKQRAQISYAAPLVDGLNLHQRLVLTFDDGPEPKNTLRVLDLLDNQGVKAIFFVNGYRFRGQNEQGEKNREVLREIVRRGHFVGNHTVNHLFLCGKKGLEVAEEEIVQNAKLIEEVTGIAPYFFRTPFGSHCPLLTAIFKKLNIDPIGWSVDPYDWKWRDRNKNLTAIQEGLGRLSKMQKPVIILMHDVHAETVETLPLLFEWLKTKPNFKIVNPVELVPHPKILEELRQLFQIVPKMFRTLSKSFQEKPARLYPPGTIVP